jgi:hypothetical protein
MMEDRTKMPPYIQWSADHNAYSLDVEREDRDAWNYQTWRWEIDNAWEVVDRIRREERERMAMIMDAISKDGIQVSDMGWRRHSMGYDEIAKWLRSGGKPLVKSQ